MSAETLVLQGSGGQSQAGPDRSQIATGLHVGAPPADPLAVAHEAVDRALGRRYGIVRNCVEIPTPPPLPRLRTAVAHGPLRIPGWQFRDPAQGTGVSTEFDLARLAAVAETIERYCSMAPPDHALLERASFADVCEDAVAPAFFALLSKRQYRRFPHLDPLTDNKVIDWCWAFSLTRDRAALVPAALAYFSRGGRRPNDFSPELISTGFACHISVAHAVLAGLCEVIERDALAIAWHNRLPLTRLEVDGTATGALLAGPLAGCGIDFELYQVPTDAPFPVVLAAAWNAASEPHAVVGAACRPDPVAAATKALYETCQLTARLGSGPIKTPTRIREIEDHATFYATAAGAQLLRRNLLAGDDIQQLGDMAVAETGSVVADLDGAVEALATAGLEVLVTDHTTSDVAATGFRVLRVIVPGTCDINSDARFPRLGGSRLYELPVRLGLRDEPLRESGLNLLPVPLA